MLIGALMAGAGLIAVEKGSLLSFIVVIIGGLGSVRGTVVAALLIGMSDGIISVFFTPTLAKIIATMVVALVLVFRPQGLFGTKAA